MVHLLELIEILFTADQFVESALEAFLSFFDAHLPLFGDDLLSLLQLLLLHLVLLFKHFVLLENHGLLIFHFVVFLSNNSTDSFLNPFFHLFHLFVFGLLSVIKHLL